MLNIPQGPGWPPSPGRIAQPGNVHSAGVGEESHVEGSERDKNGRDKAHGCLYFEK